MNVLITNDDGFGAPGLEALTAVAEELFDRVVVCAPENEMSGVSHAITLHDILRMTEHGSDRYSINGRPADCVLFALGSIFDEHPPDLVLSGINRGGNIGWDVYYSGTVGAAREGLIKGVPAVAMSMVGPRSFRFEDITPVVRYLLGKIKTRGVPPDTILNINIPSPPPAISAGHDGFCGVAGIRGIRATRLGRRSYQDEIVVRKDPRGRPYAWIGGAVPFMEDIDGTDCNAVRDGYVSITPLHLDVTDYAQLDEIAAWNAEEDPCRTPSNASS